MKIVRIRLPTATIDIDGDTVVTTLPDGFTVLAMPMNDDASRSRAKALGYRNVGEMTRAHDLLYSLLACWLGLPASPVLTRKAHHDTMTAEESGPEEAAVLALAKLLNLHGIDAVKLAKRWEIQS